MGTQTILDEKRIQDLRERSSKLANLLSQIHWHNITPEMIDILENQAQAIHHSLYQWRAERVYSRREV